MAFEFPTNPSVGDTYSLFTWDGEAWNKTAVEQTPTSTEFTFQNTTTGTTYNYRNTPNPSSGQWSLQPNQSSPTSIHINGVTAGNTDLTNLWLLDAIEGHTIYAQDRDDASNFGLYKITGPAVTDNDHLDIPCTKVDGSGSFRNNQECVLVTRTYGLGVIRQGDNIQQLASPTGADGEPSDYNLVIIDKSNGSVKTIPAPDFIEVE
jgi:hypothetical protein